MTPAPYDDVRIWQTHLSVPNAHIHLPVPEMIVEEEQKTPAYRWDGKKRSEEGAQMVITLSGEGRLALAGTKIPLINTIHISERRKGKKLFFMLDRLTFPLADACTAVSNASAKFHCNICGLKKGVEVCTIIGERRRF